ncbi:MAG: type I methionyl aminopeptidase [Eubacteriales bacterium]|nr:type I methionyl aminopeptidase [Eubacteriales bacterium]
MAVSVKSKREIEIMREAGRILGTVLNELSKEIKPGMTTHRIDQLGEEMIRSYGCVPSFLGYQGYPASICVSVNEEIVHGIPSKKRILHEGDIVSMDAGVLYKGYHSDAARTVGVGEISGQAQQLIEVTTKSFFEGIKFAREGCHLHEISNAIAAYNEEYGYGMIRDLVGHGIGAELHEDPQIPNFKQDRRGIRLYEGMTLAIEPMVSAGDYIVKWLDDDWTAVTADKSLSAHYENTVLVTKNGPEILSLVEE